MKNLLILTLTIILLMACGRRTIKGTGEVITTEKTLQTFSKVNIDAPVDVIILLTQGTPSITISGYENLIKELTIKEVNGSLEIITNDYIHWQTDKKVTITLHVSSLPEIELHKTAHATLQGMNATNDFKAAISGASILTTDEIKALRTEIEISGASKMYLKSVNGKELDIDISGGGQLHVEDAISNVMNTELSGGGQLIISKGRIINAVYDLSGGAIADVFALQTDDVKAEVSGSGKMNITVLKQLTATVSGGGQLNYKGHPAVTNVHTNGAGVIKTAD